MRLRLVVALVAGLLTVPAAPAQAHARAEVAFLQPSAGSEVSGPAVDVLLEGRSTAGTGLAEFTLSLDGQPVDRNGKVGAAAAFTSLSLRPQEQLRIRIDAPEPGPHELRVVYAPDPDDPKEDVVVDFTVAGASPTASPTPSSTIGIGSGFSTTRPEPPGESPDESDSAFPLLAGALVAAVLAAAVAGATVLRRRRTPPAA